MYQPPLTQVRILCHDRVVLPPKHAHLAQRRQIDQLSPDAIVHVMIVIGNFVGEIGNLSLKPGLPPVDEALAERTRARVPDAASSA